MHDLSRSTPWTAVRSGSGKTDLYDELVRELDALLAGEPDGVANAAALAALEIGRASCRERV